MNCIEKVFLSISRDENQNIEYNNHPFTFNEDQMKKPSQQEKTQNFFSTKHKKFSFEDYKDTAKQGILKYLISRTVELAKMKRFQSEFQSNDENYAQHSQSQSHQVNQLFLSALDDYIEQLNENENIFNDRSTLYTDNSVISSEGLFYQKLNYIKQKHQELYLKYSELVEKYKVTRTSNKQLVKQIQEMKTKFENEKLKMTLNSSKLEKKVQSLNTKVKFLQESFIQEKFQNEKNRRAIKQLMEYESIQQQQIRNMKQQPSQQTSSSISLVSQEVVEVVNQNQDRLKYLKSNSYFKSDDMLTQFLRQQMKQLHKNNKQIDQFQDEQKRMLGRVISESDE